MRFEVEAKHHRRGRAFVDARLLDHRSFRMCGPRFLGPVAVESWFGQPSTGPDGELRSDLLRFALTDPSDLHRIEVGDRLELSQSC